MVQSVMNKIYYIFLLLIVHPSLVAQHVLTYQHLFRVDTTFSYAESSYYNNWGGHVQKSKEEKQAVIKKMNQVFTPYLINQPKKLIVPSIWDAKWSLFPCDCKMDSTNKTLSISQDIFDGIGGSYRTITLSYDNQLSARLKIVQDMTPVNQDFDAKEIILVLNRNPFTNWKKLEGQRVFMDRIIEGYTLIHFDGYYSTPYKAIFRCFIELEGEEWEFKRKEVKKE